MTDETVFDTQYSDDLAFMRRAARLFDASVLVLFGLVFVTALEFHRLAGYFPLVSGALGFILASWKIVRDLRSSSRGGASVSVDPATPNERPDWVGARTEFAAALYYFAWIIGLLVLARAVGLLPSILVFVSLFLWREGSWRWMTAMGAAFLSVISIYLFAEMLDLRWPRAAFDLLRLL